MSFDNYERLFDSEYEIYDERRFSQPIRGRFDRSDEGLAIARRDSPCSVDRPASGPAAYPDIDWYLPPGGIHHSRAEEQRDANIKTRIDVWISRLDRLILDPSQADNAPAVDALITEMLSSQETLGSSGSSSSTEVAGSDYEGREGASPCPSLDEVLQAFESRGHLTTKTYSKANGKGEGQEVKVTAPPVEYHTGTVCSNIDEAREILNTRYKLEDIAIDRKAIITWSKWNVSHIVRGPHEESPIWNPSVQKKYYDRPNSIVFRELDKEIDRRNEELEKIVKRKTEHCRRFSPPQTPPSSSPSHCPISPQMPFACPSNASSSPPGDASSSQQIQEIPCQRSSSKSYPMAYPPVVMTTEEAANPSVAMATEEAANGPPSGAGLGLLRRMVKSFWSIFVGDRGCHGDATNSREVLRDDETPKP